MRFSAAFGSATKPSFSPTEFANVQERLEEPGEAASIVPRAAARNTNSSGRKGGGIPTKCAAGAGQPSISTGEEKCGAAPSAEAGTIASHAMAILDSGGW